MVFSQDDSQVSIDDLFSVDGEESAEEAPDEAAEEVEPEVVDIAALTTSPTKVSGKVSAGLGIGAGLIEWPGSAAADDRSFSDLMRFSGLYSTTASVRVDSRPASYLRFFAEAETSLSSASLIFTAPYMKEIFIDYTFSNTLFFRVGRQSLTWGQGRLLGNPANLVSRVESGIALRATLPLGPGTLNGVIYGIGSWIGNPYSNINPRSYAYAGQWDTSIGPVALNLSGHYKELDPSQEDIAAALSFSFGLGPVDFAVDGVGYWNPESFTPAPVQWAALAQIFWENDDRSWSVLSEYKFDSSVAGFAGHHAGLGVKMPKIFGSSWRPALRYKHAFQDNSGEIIAGIDGTIAPKITLAVGLPIVYGAPGTYYRAALTSGVASAEGGVIDEDSLIPIDNVVSLLLSISLSFSF